MGLGRKRGVKIMIIMVIVLGLVLGFIIGCIYVLASRLIHVKIQTSHTAGFSHSESRQLTADSEILRNGRTERSSGNYRMEDQES